MRLHPRYAALFLATLFFVSLTSFAGYQNYKDYKGELIQPVVCCSRTVLRDGLYVGLGVGYDTYRSNQDISVDDLGGFPDNGNPKIASPGMLGEIFLGYGRYFELFYIAGEIFGTYSGANSSFALNNYYSKFNVHGSYGFSIIPGVRVNDLALLYARLGYTRSYLKVNESQPGLFNDTTTHWGNGINMGVGLEVALPRNFSLRGEYNYISYQAFSTELKTSLSPADNQFVLSALYHFDFI